MVSKPAETPEFLAIAQILRSKKNAGKLIKALKGSDFPTLVAAAKTYKKDLREKAALVRLASTDSAEDTQERKEILYVLRTMALAGLPHSPYKKSELLREIRLGPTQWVRMKLTARDFGDGVMLPFGLNARRVFIMLCTIAVETQSPIITLDSTMEFMRRMGWKLNDAQGNLAGHQYRSMRLILEGFQKMTMDLDYHGVFSRRGKTADSFSIIRRYHLPSMDESKESVAGKRPLFGVEDTNEDPELGPPGLFWVRLDQLFFEELVGVPGKGRSGTAFPFTSSYLLKFTSSKEIDAALFLAARCSAAETRSTIDLHAVWNQLGIDPTNYSMFKQTFTKTLAKVKENWDGCLAYIPEGTQTLVIEPVPEGKEMVPRTLADSMLDDFISRSTPESRARDYIAMAEEEK